MTMGCVVQAMRCMRLWQPRQSKTSTAKTSSNSPSQGIHRLRIVLPSRVSSQATLWPQPPSPSSGASGTTNRRCFAFGASTPS